MLSGVCAVILVGVPLLLGFTVSRLLAEPFFEVAQAYNPEIFHPTALQRAEGGREVHKHELRLRMEVAIGRIEPLTDDEMLVSSIPGGPIAREAPFGSGEFEYVKFILGVTATVSPQIPSVGPYRSHRARLVLCLPNTLQLIFILTVVRRERHDKDTMHVVRWQGFWIVSLIVTHVCAVDII
jgi:hypothetical protein